MQVNTHELIVKCPNFQTDGYDFGCDPRNRHATLSRGVRIVLFGTSLALDQPGEWSVLNDALTQNCNYHHLDDTHHRFYDATDRRLFYMPCPETETEFPHGLSNQVRQSVREYEYPNQKLAPVHDVYTRGVLSIRWSSRC